MHSITSRYYLFPSYNVFFFSKMYNYLYKFTFFDDLGSSVIKIYKLVIEFNNVGINDKASKSTTSRRITGKKKYSRNHSI